MLLKCKYCGIQFEKLDREYRRQVKKTNRTKNDFFCSLSCSAKNLNNNLSKSQKKKRNKRFRSIQPVGTQYAREKNTKGKFTKVLNKCRNRYKDKDYDFDIDEIYLTELWEKQDKKCALTGISIILENANYWNSASLDRIDSNLGYIKKNVQFVCTPINLMKSNKSNSEVLEFIDLISSSKRSKMSSK